MLAGRVQPRGNMYAMMRIAILSGILFLSGIGSLIFETLWLRLSGLTFGNSVWSAALILSSFMAGLALGNAIAASSKIRQWRPLHLYAVLEMAVALFGCAIVFGLPLLGGWIRPVFQTLWSYQPILTGLRLVLSFLILLLPTTAMGLTLPVLIEDPILRRTDFGRAIGLLYGFNTLGAVAGALAHAAGREVWALGLLGRDRRCRGKRPGSDQGLWHPPLRFAPSEEHLRQQRIHAAEPRIHRGFSCVRRGMGTRRVSLVRRRQALLDPKLLVELQQDDHDS